MVFVMSAEQVRELMPDKDFDNFIELVTAQIPERAKKGFYHNTISWPAGKIPKSLIVRAKDFLEKLGYKIRIMSSEDYTVFQVGWGV